MWRRIKLSIFSITFAVQSAMAAKDTSSNIKGLIGDPFTYIEPLKDVIQFLTGTTLGIFIMIALVAIFVAGILGYAGHASGSASTKNKATSGLIGIIYITLLTAIAIILFIAIVSKFILA